MARKKIPVNGILLLHYIAGGKRSDSVRASRGQFTRSNIRSTITGLDKTSFGKEREKEQKLLCESYPQFVFPSFIPSVSFCSLEVNIDQKTQLLFLLIVNGAKKKGKNLCEFLGKKREKSFSCRGIDTTWRPIHNGTTV